MPRPKKKAARKGYDAKPYQHPSADLTVKYASQERELVFKKLEECS